MIAANQAPGKFSITGRLFKLVGDMPKDQQLILLKQLVGDSVSAQLYKLIVEMTEEQQIILLEQMQELPKENLPKKMFPASVCGEVCPNLCMDACSRRYIDKPVAMKELGRLSRNVAAPELKAETGKQVAVIGGGPGGLAAAHWRSEASKRANNKSVSAASKL